MDAYIYNADLWCKQCARKIMERCGEDTGDSDEYPQGPYSNGGGPADCPAHCAGCGTMLENPLTEDGKEYVRESLHRYMELGAGDKDVLQKWSEYYGISFPSPEGSIECEKLGQKCALEAIEAAGADPTDADGESLLPTEPMEGDWDYLADNIQSREPTDEERVRFSRAFRKAMANHATVTISSGMGSDTATCPGCESEIAICDEAIGTEIFCPECDTILRVKYQKEKQ